MVFGPTFIFVAAYALYLGNVSCFRFHESWNPLYHSSSPMKRSLTCAQQQDSVHDSADFNPYRFVDVYRIVPPYVNVYKTYVKERWRFKPLRDVLKDEFVSLNEDYLNYASSKGVIKVFDKDEKEICPSPDENILDHILQLNEQVVHYATVHEPIAINSDIKVLENTDEYILVSKPASVPVYQTGTYRYNTLIEIMKRELDCVKDTYLYTVHRIDKLVSGVVAFAKNSEAASKMAAAIKEGDIKKVYIARVAGNFSEFARNAKDYDLDGVDDDVNRIVSDEGFMHVVSKKNSAHEFTKDARDDSYKPAKTRFRFLAYNEKLDESLILCSPVTGRTHQLRAHLKYLGFAISNDPCYNNGRCVDSEEYFTGIPVVNWQLDLEGNWTIPEIGLRETAGKKPEREQSIYHVGMNSPEDTNTKAASGIFLHALRLMWEGTFDVCDSLPRWMDKFDISPSLDIRKLKMW